MPHYQILVTGKVQGVFYRQSAAKQATSLGLKGWVKNNPDGTVSCLASGNEAALKQFIDWCRQGPPLARVKNVSYSQSEHGPEQDGFIVLRD